jgi:hypothetical protein
VKDHVNQNAKAFAEYLSNGSMGSGVKKQRRCIDLVVIIKSAGKSYKLSTRFKGGEIHVRFRAMRFFLVVDSLYNHDDHMLSHDAGTKGFDDVRLWLPSC